MRTYFLLGLSILLLFSCKKKSTENPSPAQNTSSATPLSLNYPDFFGQPDLPTSNPLTVEGVALGRLLFYEKMLSSDNTISCASCHKQKFAFADSLAFSNGVKGGKTTRNSPSLSNVAWEKAFFWDGRASSLEDQVHFPVENPPEMGSTLQEGVQKLSATTTYPPLFKKAFGSETITSDRIVNAIAQFERTIISSGSRFDQFLAGNHNALTTQEQNGYILFSTHPIPEQNVRGGNCGDCHGGFLLSFGSFANNGLDSVFTDEGYGGFTGKQEDMGKFKIPSLRNIELTAPYMHDGRFQTLEEVMNHYNEHIVVSPTLSPLMYASNTVNGGISLDLTSEEIQDILAFLKTLTDTSFINNPNFSDPF